MPLSLPRADWLLSLEVGEHIQSRHEAMVMRNLHAHNCRGLILSWGEIGKAGVGHVNNHSPAYLRQLLEELGYQWNEEATLALRAHRSKSTGQVPMILFDYRKLFGMATNGIAVPRGQYRIGVRNVSRAWWWLTAQVFERRVPVRGEGCTRTPPQTRGIYGSHA